MDKTVIAEENPHMGNIIPAVVGTDEKHQITSFQCVPVRDNLSVPGLFLGASGQFNPVGSKRDISQPGTVHAPGGGSTHAMGGTDIFFGRPDHLVGFDAVCPQRFTGSTVQEGLQLAVGNYRRGDRKMPPAAGGGQQEQQRQPHQERKTAK